MDDLNLYDPKLSKFSDKDQLFYNIDLFHFKTDDGCHCLR